MHGTVGKDDGVLVIQRIHVKYSLKAAGGAPEVVQRAFEAHPMRCPVYRTLHRCIEITTELETTTADANAGPEPADSERS